MAVKTIDVTGKTEDEAVSRALAQLGLERDAVSVEILERAKSGFLGIGARPAKVRITYGLEEVVAPKPPVQPVKSVKVEKPVEKAEKPERPVRPANPEKPAAPKAEPEDPARPPKAQRPKPPRQAPVPAEPEEAPAAPRPRPEDLGELCTDEKAQQITAFLTGLLEHMDHPAQVKVYQPEKGRYKVILEGEKLGALIGRRGETLDAIQQLTSYSVNRGGDKRVRVHVDAEDYRLKREESLCRLAHKVAAKVVKYRRSVTLEPMNAYERHVIHTALQNVENVTTYSMGTDPNRRVIVAYEKGQKNQEK